MTTSFRLRTLPIFPSRINGLNGIKVTRAEGSTDLVVSPDFQSLGDVTAVPDPTNNYFLMWDSVNDHYVRIPFGSMFDANGVSAGYPTIAAASLADIPVSIHAVEVYGTTDVGDGGAGLFIDTDNGSAITFVSGDGRTWYKVKDVTAERMADNSVATAAIVDLNVTTAKIVDDAVTNAKLANVATGTIKGRTTAGTGDPEDLTKAQARVVLGETRETKSGNYTITADDIGKTIQFTASAVASFQAAATLGANFTCEVWADDGAVVQFSPSGSETINGLLDMVIQRGQRASVWCDGTALFAKVTSDAQSGPQAAGYRIFGMTLANDTGGDVTNDIIIATGSAPSDTSPYNVLTLASALTKRTDAAWAAGTGNGGWLDGASMPNGWGFVFAIGQPDTGAVDVGISASLSPSLPANYTQKSLIGAIFRTGGAIKAFRQQADGWISWVSPPDDVNLTTLSTTGALVTLTVPPIAGAFANLSVSLNFNANTAIIWVREADQVNDAPSVTNRDLAVSTGVTLQDTSILRHVNASGQIRYRSSEASVTTFVIRTQGYRIPLQ